MAKIKAFKGYRPPKNIVEKLASFPYDVINSEEAREIAKGNEYSFLHIVKPEIDLDKDVHIYNEKVYDKAVDNFNMFIEKGYLVKDNEDHIYIYAQKMGNHTQIGILACNHAQDYEDNIIKKHEFTRKDKEADRTKHVEKLNANTGPVFLTYRSRDEINSIVNNIMKNDPEYDFTTKDKISHILWLVKDKVIINNIIKEFSKIDVLYIADGHHRAASAANIGLKRKKENPDHTGDEEYNWFMSVIFPHDQLKIYDYNRVIKDLNGMKKEEFIKELADIFEIEEYSNSKVKMYRPENLHYIGMYIDKKWYKLKIKENIYKDLDIVKSLDVSILQDNVLDKLLNIKDPRTDNRVNFIGGIRGLEELVKVVDSNDYIAAFSMYPTSIEELMNIADSGKTMPPKSTWFEPKLRSGIVVHSLD